MTGAVISVKEFVTGTKPGSQVAIGRVLGRQETGGPKRRVRSLDVAGGRGPLPGPHPSGLDEEPAHVYNSTPEDLTSIVMEQHAGGPHAGVPLRRRADSSGGDRRSALPAGLRVDLLVAFVVVAEELHFTRAADRLFLSQSGLSRRIIMLEAVLGVPLVLRSTRVVELTSGGEALLPHATAILAAVRDATEAARGAPSALSA